MEVPERADRGRRPRAASDAVPRLGGYETTAARRTDLLYIGTRSSRIGSGFILRIKYRLRTMGRASVERVSGRREGWASRRMSRTSTACPSTVTLRLRGLQRREAVIFRDGPWWVARLIDEPLLAAQGRSAEQAEERLRSVLEFSSSLGEPEDY